MSDPTSGGAPPERSPRRGPLAWMARHHVAANLVMLVLLVGGLIRLPQVAREVFPQVTLDVVVVEVDYPGASPEEVEQGVVLAVEEAVRGLEGVEEVRSVADEGRAVVMVELQLAADRSQMLDDVESAVGRITAFPEDVERPIISLATNRQQVVSLIYHGAVDERALRALAEEARQDLLRDPRISFVDLSGVRPPEISIELDEEALRRYGLTLPDVAARVDAASIDLPAGDIETGHGEVVLRVTEREERADAFEEISLVARPDGSVVRLGDVARVADGFQDLDRAAFFDGEPAVRVEVYRVGDETPLDVAAAAREYAERASERLPPSVDVAVWSDISEIYSDRVDLLLRNGYLGLALVLLLLGLFLDPRLAFWVTLGIPVSFLGALLILPATDVSINILSLFGFIVTLGLVVDDAIVVGEAIYRHRKEGKKFLEASLAGVREVARPVTFAIITTCLAFSPMLFVPGVSGDFFRNIPVIVILVLLGSLVESLLVLPAHLSRPMPRLLEIVISPFLWLMSLLRSDKVSKWLDRAVDRLYVPFVRRAMEWRYLTAAVALLLLLGTISLQVGGVLQFTFLPRVEDDEVSATLRMPVGTSFDVTLRMQERIADAARRVGAVIEEESDEELPPPIEGVYAVGGLVTTEDDASVVAGGTGSHVASVQVDLVPLGQRAVSSSEFTERWRREVGSIPGAELLSFKYTTGATTGRPIDLRLTHPDLPSLRAAASELAGALERYEGVREVDDGFSPGKDRLDLTLTAKGRALGLTEAELARQVRGAFFGAEAQRFQRERNEVRVYARLAEEERGSVHDLETLVLRTSGGTELPLLDVVDVDHDRAFTEIERTDMERSVHVTADVMQERANANEVVADLREKVLPGLAEKYPGLSHAPGGEQERQAETLASLLSGFGLALVAIFALLAIAFESYVQPLIVLSAIPFGFVGAVAGHLLLGFDLSVSSMFGFVALAGVVVNDSLLLVMAVNDERGRRGMAVDEAAPAGRLEDAVTAGGARRFQAVLMTSLTTFFGLAPMIFETSVQARFLIPMALSLGFGILFATAILLLLVPCLYMMLEDVRRLVGRSGSVTSPRAAT